MATSRARKANQTELNKLLKELNRRMEDFEDSVSKSKELKECVVELDDTISEKAERNKNELEKLDRDFHDNKIRTITQSATEIGKIVISREELQELKTDLEKIKEHGKNEIKEHIENEKKKYEEKLEQELSIKKLKHEAETAKLHASMESHKKEVENFKDTLERMAEELKSQKNLTASVVSPRVTVQSQQTPQ